MRLNDNGVKLTFKIPVGKPDLNGVIYTPEAIERALKEMDCHLPIVYRGDESNTDTVVGHTTNMFHNVVWDHDGCAVEIDGVLHYGGAELMINEIRDNVVTDFRIVSIGISR